MTYISLSLTDREMSENKHTSPEKRSRPPEERHVNPKEATSPMRSEANYNKIKNNKTDLQINNRTVTKNDIKAGYLVKLIIV